MKPWEKYANPSNSEPSGPWMKYTAQSEVQPKEGLDRAVDIARQAADLGSAYMDSRTWGLGPKVGSAIGATASYPIVAAIKAARGQEIPSLAEQYEKGVEMYSAPGKRAFDENMALALAATIAGGGRTAYQLGTQTKIGRSVADSLRSGNLAARTGKGAAAGAASGAIYGAGEAEPGEEASGALYGAAWGAGSGGGLPLAGAGLRSAAQGSKNIVKGATARSGDALDDALQSIRERSTKAYQYMRDVGARFSPEASNQIFYKIGTKLAGDGPLNPLLHDKVLAVMGELTEVSRSGDMNLEKLDQWRQVLGDIAGNFSDKVNARKAKLLIEAIDESVENIRPKDLSSGSVEAVDALKFARQEWARARKFELISDIVKKSDGDANYLKREIKKLVDNPKKIRGFRPSEVNALRQAATLSAGEGIMKMLGKFGIDFGNSRIGNTALPLVGGTAAAATSSTGLGVAVPVIGTAARYGQKALARGKTENLLQEIEKSGTANFDDTLKTGQMMRQYGSSELGRNMANNKDIPISAFEDMPEDVWREILKLPPDKAREALQRLMKAKKSKNK